MAQDHSCDHHGVPFRSLSDHLAAVLAVGKPTATRTVATEESAGLVLAEDARANLPVPPFSNSAMDGFLVRAADLPAGDSPWELPVSGDIPAGQTPIDVAPGTAVRIMTGAPTPVNTEGLMVVPVEDTNVPAGAVALPDKVVITTAHHDRTHIRHQGENCQVGDIIAHAGTVIDAGVIASLLSTGVTSVEAYDRPTVAVISSGDELVASVDSVDQLRPGTIPDSNRPMLAELLREQGVAKVRSVVVDDDAATFRKQLDALSRECDLVVTSGGVSAGAFDVVKEALTNPAASGATDMWFGPVQIQPGKPQGLGRVNGTPVICLPGNPVSSFVCFYLFVMPLVRVLSGIPPQAAAQQARLMLPSHDHIKAPKGRDLFIPCAIDWTEGDVHPVIPGGMGSHFVASLVGISAIIHLPLDHGKTQPGDLVPVILLKV